MKQYKKMLIVAPLACMLGTGIFALPNATHAASSASSVAASDPYRQGTYYTPENLAQTVFNRLRSGIENSPELRKKFKIADDEAISVRNTQEADFKGILSKIQVAANGSYFEVNPTIDSYEDLGQTNLLTINNDNGIVPQTAQTPETTEKYIETMSYSNSTGMKLGIGMSTTLKVKIPFDLGEASQTINMSSEFSFNNTSTQTSTHEKSVTFKSQPVVAAPGGTTTYYGSIKKAKFSGSFQSDAYVAGGISLKLDIVKKSNLVGDTVHTEEATLTPEDIYAIFKNEPHNIPLPPYLRLDDQNKKVMVNNATFTFNGEGGYYSAIQIKFTPKDPNKPAQVMPYKEYVAKAQAKSL